MSILAAAAVALRLLNPNDVAVEATLRCGEEPRAVTLAAHELRDVEGCESADALVPVVALQTFLDDEGREWQQAAPSDMCGTPPPMAVPLFACRNGEATAYVAPRDGATYSWTVSGATITSDPTKNHITLQLGEAETATLECIVVTAECTHTATGIIAVREPIVVKSFTVAGTVSAGKPLTISWTYEEGREPVTQLLTGDLFPQPVLLAPEARSYTVTPQGSGMRTAELHASYARATLKKRRRRAVGGGATAAECPAATASARVDVQGCGAREPVLRAPDDVPAGTKFEVRATELAGGEKIEWSVVNGRIDHVAPFGTRAIVIAGTSGKTEVQARVESAPGCFALGSAAVAIIQPLGSCSTTPTATLSLVSESCNRAVVRARFTGKPPFAGRWSDGSTFRSTGTFAEKEFTTAGTYGMVEFHDASCFGTVSGSPSATLKRPTVKIEAVPGCAGGQVTATFTGTPPFKGTWSDGQAFTTSSTTLTRAVGTGTWSVQNVTDATCTAFKASSNSVTFGPAPRASVAPLDVCLLPYDYEGSFTVQTTGGQPPYVYEFTDGTTFTTPHARTFMIVPLPASAKTYELERVTANGCEATLENRWTTLTRRTPAELNRGTIQACTQTDLKIASIWQPSYGASLEWAVWAPGFSNADPYIVSGDATPEVTIRSRRPGEVHVGVQTVWSPACDYRSNVLTINFVTCSDAEATSPASVTRRQDAQ